MHTLPDNTIFCTLGTPGLATSGTWGAPAVYQSMSDAEYINFYISGTGSAVGPFGTVNVWQGTDSSGGSPKIVTGATLTLGTSGTAWALVVKADQLDTANNYTFINAVGTTPTAGTAFVSLFSLKNNKRVSPGTQGLAGSVYVVS